MSLQLDVLATFSRSLNKDAKIVANQYPEKNETNDELDCKILVISDFQPYQPDLESILNSPTKIHINNVLRGTLSKKLWRIQFDYINDTRAMSIENNTLTYVSSELKLLFLQLFAVRRDDKNNFTYHKTSNIY